MDSSLSSDSAGDRGGPAAKLTLFQRSSTGGQSEVKIHLTPAEEQPRVFPRITGPITDKFVVVPGISGSCGFYLSESPRGLRRRVFPPHEIDPGNAEVRGRKLTVLLTKFPTLLVLSIGIGLAGGRDPGLLLTGETVHSEAQRKSSQ